ncbi:ABC transporter permease [uncultured Mucilaginibacter sp.]|uniref:ABC transporter permease n=1 Tax=uncultured Mucilaginibacter sp. TaxID=797541 RepID=UPI0025DE1209|nr:ABC transporter permease [uncultured Mucilaginibacter sp.]
MKGFLLSLQSEFYKSRKTLGFWGAILLPTLIMFSMSVGFYFNAHKLVNHTPEMLWGQFAGIPLAIMGSLLLPMYIIFVAYSVNVIEHKSDTWKTLFTLPIPKWSIYTAKYLFAVILILITLTLFFVLTIAFGTLLGNIQPKLKFGGFHIETHLFQVYAKLFFASQGIIALQFLMSLLWKDFLKPMGIGFVGTIAGVILTGPARWEYAYLFPYAQPLLSVMGVGNKKIRPTETPVFFTNEVLISMAIAVVIFITGYFILQRRSIK